MLDILGALGAVKTRCSVNKTNKQFSWFSDVGPHGSVFVLVETNTPTMWLVGGGTAQWGFVCVFWRVLEVGVNRMIFGRGKMKQLRILDESLGESLVGC